MLVLRLLMLGRWGGRIARRGVMLRGNWGCCYVQEMMTSRQMHVKVSSGWRWPESWGMRKQRRQQHEPIALVLVWLTVMRRQ